MENNVHAEQAVVEERGMRAGGPRRSNGGQQEHAPAFEIEDGELGHTSNTAARVGSASIHLLSCRREVITPAWRARVFAH
eukprot:9835903-Alexandrium_andersonii.AAC.1